MTTLIVIIPSRERLKSSAATPVTPSDTPGEYDYLVSQDDRNISAQGRSAAGLLPRADKVIAVLGEHDVSWHQITIPKAPTARMASALEGVLEEAFLDNAETLLLALDPEARQGEPGWVAAIARDWLAKHLTQLEKAQVFVDRVVPVCWPEHFTRGHFHAPESDEGLATEDLVLSFSHPLGVNVLSLSGTLARTLVNAGASPENTHYTATPAVAAQAERWLGAPVKVLATTQRQLLALHSPWNMRQFQLAARTKGLRALREFIQEFRGPRWRPVRYGAIALVAVHILGINLSAWHERAALKERRDSMNALLQTTYPQIRAVLDAPVQMQRETDTLRNAAGRIGQADFESLAGAAASAWPPGKPVANALQYEPGKLSIGAPGWSDDEVRALRNQLQSEGIALEYAEGRLILKPAVAGNTTGGKL